jgi:hypothetical protein
MRPILVFALMFVIAGSIFLVAAQERQPENKGTAQTSEAKSAGDQIEVKTDRFSGVTTLKLKPQVILDKPEHRLTIEVETKVGDKSSSEWAMDEVHAYFRITSQSKGFVDFGDRELHFMLDGKPLNFGKVAGRDPNFVSIFNRGALEQFSKASRIEMRFGTIEPTIGQSVATLLREYAKQTLASHKAAKERKL